MLLPVTAGSGRAPGSGGRVVGHGGGRAVEGGGGRAVECGGGRAVESGGRPAVERGSRRAMEEDEDRTETRTREKDGDKDGGTDRDKDGDNDKDRDKTERRTETRTRTRTRTRWRQGHSDGVNKLLRTDLRRATALVIYTNSRQHPREQTPTRANTDTSKHRHVSRSAHSHIPAHPFVPLPRHPASLRSRTFPRFSVFPHFCGPATSALHVIRRRDSSPPLGSSSHESELSWCAVLRVALMVVIDGLHLC